jgi:phosphoglycolate phosphatase-like HAD superfamily hydrolase
MEKTLLPKQKPDLMIFDLDETILDHTDILRKEVYDAFKKASDKQFRSIGAQMSKLGAKQHHAHIKLRMIKDWIGAKHPELKEYAKDLGSDFSEATLTTARPSLYPGVTTFLEQAAGSNIETHLVTRTHPEWLGRISKEQNLPSLFDTIRSTCVEPKLFEKQQAFAQIIDDYNNKNSHAPSVWIIGDNISDYPDLKFMAENTKFSEIQLIAASKTCNAYDWLNRTSGEAYYIGSYKEASRHFSNLVP